MTRRRLPLTLAVVGVLIILAAIIAASVLRSSDTATLTLGERPDVPVVVTEPGVLDAVDAEVTVRATAGDDEPVVLAIGRTSEVEAWLGDADHARVTGLSSWEELTVEVVTGDPEEPAAGATDAATPTQDAPAADDEAPGPTSLPDPAGSDLWVVEAAATGTAELSWTDSPGRWSLVAATDGSAPAPELELEWGRQVSTPWLVPAIVIGALAVVVGAAMLILDVLARREQRRRDEARARREAAEDELPPVSITDTDPGTGERLTRRQIREMERAMARAERNRRDGEALPPPVPLAPGEDEDDDAATADQDDSVDDATAGGAERTHGPDVDRADATGANDDLRTDGADRAAGPGPAETDDELELDESQEDEGYAPTPPSWRSVWGFGGAAATGPADPEPDPAPEPAPEDHDDHDDGEERR